MKIELGMGKEEKRSEKVNRRIRPGDDHEIVKKGAFSFSSSWSFF